MARAEVREERRGAERRPLLSHISELLRRLRRILVALGVTFFLTAAFDVRDVSLYGVTIPVPYPSIYDSVSSRLIRAFIYNELPPGLHLININPFDPLFASLYVSFFLSLFVAIPVAVRELWAFVSPGLYKHERNAIKYAVLPAFGLFAAGSAFAYLVVVPLMMDFVLHYTQVLGVEPTLSLRAFVSMVISLTVATGVAFEYPLVMGVLTFLGVVGARTWRRNWRWGVLGAFIIAWIISPGTTGGIMETVIGIILSALYFVGVAAAYTIERRRSHGVSYGYEDLR
ncbi:MAG: twin-arginine translocase subunit TatC [Nitrososphaeria archaeon]